MKEQNIAYVTYTRSRFGSSVAREIHEITILQGAPTHQNLDNTSSPIESLNTNSRRNSYGLFRPRSRENSRERPRCTHKSGSYTVEDSDTDGYETAKEEIRPLDQQLDEVRVQISEMSTSQSQWNYATFQPPLISVSTSVVSNRCRSNCHCRCHKQSQYRTPAWARSIIGSFNFSGNGSIFLNRPQCSYRGCKRSGQTSVRFTYYAPLWYWLGR
jgi:hypothetical protein